MPELLLEGIHLDGPHGRPVFDALDLHLMAGASMLVEGGTGSSRGQLLRLAAGLIEPTQGRVVLSGIQVWPGEGLTGLKGRLRLGFAFGRGGLLANLSLLDNLELPLLFSSAQNRLQIRDRVMGELAGFDLEALSGQRPHMLDGRVRTLANLIRVKLMDPQIILLDDPYEELEASDMVKLRGWMDAWIKDSERIVLMAAENPDLRAYPPVHRMQLIGGRLMEAA